MNDLIRRIPCAAPGTGEDEPMLTREWLVTNGLGGYATGTLAGVPTRRYHGLLVAALPNPLGRSVMLNHLTEIVRLADRTTIGLGGEERKGTHFLDAAGHLAEFRLEMGIPVWRYELGGVVIEKRVWMLHHQNTVHVQYRLIEGNGPIRLQMRPAVHFRGHEAAVSDALPKPHVLTAIDDRYELCGDKRFPPLRLAIVGKNGSFTLHGEKVQEVLYRIEESRGYQASGDLWSPGHFRVEIDVNQPATLIASTETWETIDALSPIDALRAELERRQSLLARAHVTDAIAADLVLAADSFIITPAGRAEEAARAHASGDEVRTVIAGYHWFTDWGRDTMISLEGLTLSTGRHLEAGYILRTFAHYVNDGLIPNMFPEGKKEGLYHTADATLWFFHAIDRYLATTGDRATLQRILPKLIDIAEHHVRGTQFGIGVDARDGLLAQGADGYQLTWMDAKVDGWVVTPRRGKAVEINALWYNALAVLSRWLSEEGDNDRALRFAALGARAKASFDARFWNPETNHLHDIVDCLDGPLAGTNDPACRPNQIFAISLPNPILDRSKWEPVLSAVRERLLTPVGLRSLAPGHPDYKAKYYGDLRTRDAAYHQGTVWGWLIGPFIDAHLKVHPGDRAGARKLLEGIHAHLNEGCIGSVSEIFDAEAPYTARGCIAQAWSVAEALRCWIATEPEPSTPR